MRDHPIVISERRALEAYSNNIQSPASPEFLRFLRGAGAALDWATATTGSAPVSPGTLPADPESILAEVGRCDALLGRDGTVTALRSDPHYLNGVEHALRWVLELEGEPPVPLEPLVALPAPGTAAPAA
jgi:hypothetical protein